MIRYIDNIDYNYLKDIADKIKNKYSVSKEDINYFLQCIVYITRMNIMDNGNEYFDYKCDLAQSIIYYYLEDLGIKGHPNMTIPAISKDIIGHSFICATFKVDDNDINYLIDPTYIQFFKKENCNSDRYVYFNDLIIRTPDPGYFIKEEDRETINKFNYNGFGELTDDLARIYGNSFYFTKTGITKNEISIPGKVFINSFMKGNERLSETREDLIFKGYYIALDGKKYIK